MITDAIFGWAAAAPDHIAVELNGDAWSYRAFADAIAEARGYFHKQGIEGGGYVVVAVTNLRDCWVWLLALRSLGMTVVPVDRADMIGDLGLGDIRCVVRSSQENWPALVPTCARLGLEILSVPPVGGAPLALADTAYTTGGHVLLTSGTTGQHKKVLLTADIERAYLLRRQTYFPSTPESVANLFNFSAWTGLGHRGPAGIWVGGGTVLFDQGRPCHLALRRPGLSSSTVLPTMLAEILAAPEGAFPRSETMTLRIGGGTVTQAQMDAARVRITPHLITGIACTETHQIAITPQLAADDHRWHKLVPNTRTELVDASDRPTPIGELGRVRVAIEDGPRSYLADEEATKTHFKSGYFYPGDLAIMRDDGRIALQGRITDVINVGGHKISPLPIEDELREALGLSGACLMSLQNDAGVEEYHLLIETTAELNHDLIMHSWPSWTKLKKVHIWKTPELPRNATGKLDRQALAVSLMKRRERRA